MMVVIERMIAIFICLGYVQISELILFVYVRVCEWGGEGGGELTAAGILMDIERYLLVYKNQLFSTVAHTLFCIEDEREPFHRIICFLRNKTFSVFFCKYKYFCKKI